MSRCQQVARPLVLCLRPACSVQSSAASIPKATARLFSNSPSRCDVEPTTTSSPVDAQATQDLLSTKFPASAPPVGPEGASTADQRAALKAQWLDPNTTTLLWAERKLQKQGINPIGSRRRRAAVRQTQGLPFEQLPYHAYQEARKLLAADRLKKLEEIKRAYQRLKTVEAQPAETYRSGTAHKNKMLYSLRKQLWYLKIQADINDPAVRMKWEDGLADMRKPIYRYFALKKWQSMAFKILKQRLEQFHIVPDVLPKFIPLMDVQLSFHGHQIQPGELVYSLVSEAPPNVRVQLFDDKERLVSIVVMDSDVPNAETDSFGRRLHFMAVNIPVNCLTKNISLQELGRKQQEKLVVPWLPPFSQEGAPYHRLSLWILEQAEGEQLKVNVLQKSYNKDTRDGFSLQHFRGLARVKPLGFNIFRSEWDEGTAKVMERHGIPGADVVFRRQRVRSLKPPKKLRGWEAKRQGPGYKHLWKYTKRIGKMSGGT